MSTLTQSPPVSSVDPPLNDEFYRELFSVYDKENTGYITVEKFLQISLESMSDFDKVANEQV
jgi:Ca2+-binding EF-hand superfamily protein